MSGTNSWMWEHEEYGKKTFPRETDMDEVSKSPETSNLPEFLRFL